MARQDPSVGGAGLDAGAHAKEAVRRAGPWVGWIARVGYAERVTFLLDPDGKVARVYPEVSPETHADEILEDAASL